MKILFLYALLELEMTRWLLVSQKLEFSALSV